MTTTTRRTAGSAHARRVVRELAGSMAVNVGARWEDELEEACKVYRATGAADVARLPAPYRQLGGVGPKGVFQAIRVAKGEVDFLGYTSCRGVAFDAKTTSGVRLSWAAVLPHQAEALLRAGRLGALAGLAVQFSTLGKAYFLPVHPSPAVEALNELGWSLDWASTAADPTRVLQTQLRAHLGRPLRPEEKLAGPKLASFTARQLEQLGLEIPAPYGFWDWLPVARRVCA